MNLWGRILHRRGWTFTIAHPEVEKCVVCVAPHTSNWDFIMGELCIRSVGRTASFLMKDTWFFFPLGWLLRRIGGIPVSRKKHKNVTGGVVAEFKRKKHLWVAVTPEGTRSRNEHWHKGFLHIAREAGVPVVLAYIDYSRHHVCVDRLFEPTDDTDADMLAIKRYFHDHADAARYPEKFTTGLSDNNEELGVRN
ncbi:MAG: 1-acyl-sn-glycerol-3-phosphate acyltransferase [Muribaculaceae bacterium]|nr:1-acyl-sn-glycerol-3-phosphate acyltransferase [Muribaculaceae bacterium]